MLCWCYDRERIWGLQYKVHASLSFQWQSSWWRCALYYATTMRVDSADAQYTNRKLLPTWKPFGWQTLYVRIRIQVDSSLWRKVNNAYGLLS